MVRRLRPGVPLKGGQRPAAMPERIVPMMATLSNLPADESQYGFEYKWDGVRAVSYWDGRELRIESRNLLPITNRYPELWPLGAVLGRVPAVLDGEIVAPDAQGRPSFSLLQRRMHAAEPRNLLRQVPIVYMVFDLLYFDGRDTMQLPYTRRRDMLDGLGLSDAAWQTPPWYAGEGRTLLSAARHSGLEGVVAKALTSVYEPGRRSREWLKVKVLRRQEFVVGGWTPGEGANSGGIGSLLIGYYKPAELEDEPEPLLHYAGGVGTGFTAEDHRRLLPMLKARRRTRSPFAEAVPRPNAIFIRPDLVVEVEYLEWTHASILRHPSFKGLRTDKPAREVVRETVEPQT